VIYALRRIDLGHYSRIENNVWGDIPHQPTRFSFATPARLIKAYANKLVPPERTCKRTNRITNGCVVAENQYTH